LIPETERGLATWLGRRRGPGALAFREELRRAWGELGRGRGRWSGDNWGPDPLGVFERPRSSSDFFGVALPRGVGGAVGDALSTAVGSPPVGFGALAEDTWSPAGLVSCGDLVEELSRGVVSLAPDGLDFIWATDGRTQIVL